MTGDSQTPVHAPSATEVLPFTPELWFLRPKMRTVLAVHLKVNESCTSKEEKHDIRICCLAKERTRR